MSASALHRLLALRSVIYAAVNVLPSAVALLVMPFVAQKVTPAEYGIAGMYLSLIAGLLSAMEFSIIVRKAYIRHGQEGDALSESVSASVAIYGSVIVLAHGFLFAQWEWISGFVPLSEGWVMAALFTAGMQSFISLTFALLQIAQRVKYYCALKLMFTLVNASFCLVALYGFDMGWESLAMGSLGGTCTTLLIAMWRIRTTLHVRFRLKAAELKTTLKSMLSLTPFRAALAIFTYSGPFLVAYGAGTEASGLYIFAFQTCNVIALVYDAILTAIVPYMVAHHHGPDTLDGAARRRLAACYVLAVCAAAGGLWIISPFIVYWLFPEAYAAALPFIGWVALARCLHGINRINQEISFFHTDSFRRIALASLFCAGCYVAATLYLMSVYGGIGAGMGLVAGHLLWMVMLLVLRGVLVKKR